MRRVPAEPRDVARRRTSRAPLSLLGLGALLGAIACGDRGPLSPPTLEPLVVHVDGRWFRDAKQRVVLLRGVDYPVLVRGRHVGTKPQPREEDFQRLAALGFNLIRLPMAWSSIEPRPGAYDPQYLRQHVDPLLRFASNAGMQVVLAMHQVRWSDCVRGGSGAPAWTCADTAGTPPRGGFGDAGTVAELRAARAQCAFFAGAEAPDGRTLREHYAEAWSTVAHYYEQDKRIAAFDLLNEPSAASCLPATSFVPEILTPYYRTLRRAVRGTRAPQALAYQPAVTRNDPLAGAPRSVGGRSILAPHLYGQTFGPPRASDDGVGRLADDYARAVELARALPGPLLIGEIGGDAAPQGSYRPTTPELVAASFAQLDRLLIGGAVWAVVPAGDHRAGAALALDDDATARLLARPFARRIAGVPISMELDDETGVWRFTFQDDPDRSPSDPTEIFLPARRRYPTGFTVEVSAGDRWTFDERTQRLLVYRGAGDVHTVRVAPRAR
ncbi:MAG: cellulase family glycosylhydrolase [Thermodesulfobacteriota bacterium]